MLALINVLKTPRQQKKKQVSVRHLVSQAICLLLVFRELLLPLLNAAVGFLQCRHQLGITVLQGEELSLQVNVTHGPGTQKGHVYFHSLPSSMYEVWRGGRKRWEQWESKSQRSHKTIILNIIRVSGNGPLHQVSSFATMTKLTSCARHNNRRNRRVYAIAI